MNIFPLAPFLIELESEGFRFTLHDYKRISIVLRSSGVWTINRLRSVLLSLLVRDRENKNLFLQKFNSFFKLSLEEKAVFTEIDIKSALDCLHKLAQGDYIPEEEPEVNNEPGELHTSSDQDDKQAGKRSWRLLIMLLGLSFAVIMIGYYLNQIIGGSEETPPRSQPLVTAKEEHRPSPLPSIEKKYSGEYPSSQKEYTENFLSSLKKQTYRLYKNLLYLKEIKPISSNWKIFAGVAGVLIIAIILLCSFYLLKLRSIYRSPLEWNENAPLHFRLGDICKEIPPCLSPKILDKLTGCIGYFQSDETGNFLNTHASVEDTINKGIPSLLFHKRKQSYNILILEDAFAEPLTWNKIAGELFNGLKQRAMSVIYGRFHGTLKQFQTHDNRIYSLEDIEDRQKEYLIFIFSDGKGLYRHQKGLQDTFELKSLARWCMVAWMELRTPRFWDETTDQLAEYFPIYPATREGLLRAMEDFLTKKGRLEKVCQDKKNWPRIPPSIGANLAGYVEQVSGEALMWVQACAMIQPITLGMAHALRQKFHPTLPYERIERLFAMPGTLKTVAGLRFSTPVLSVLRSGFAIRREGKEQENVLEFLLEKIKLVEPKEKKSLAYIEWEFQFERVRLELKPKIALKELERLAGSPLVPYIESEMENVRPPSEKTDLSCIPLRVEPKDEDSVRCLARITKNKNILKSLPDTRKYWLTLSVLIVFFIFFTFTGISGWKNTSVYRFLTNKVIIITFLNALQNIPARIEVKNDNIWQSVNKENGYEQTDLFVRNFYVEKGKEYRISIFNEGKQIIKELGLVNQDIEAAFEVKEESFPCQEEFPEIGLIIERCMKYQDEYDVPFNFSNWRELLGKFVPENRLQSIGIAIQLSEEQKNMLKPLGELLLKTHSIDILYTVSIGTDGQFHIIEAIDKIQERLGNWAKQSQVLLWPDYISNNELILKKIEPFGRVFIFGNMDEFSWVKAFENNFSSIETFLITEKQLLSDLPSAQVKGNEPPIVLIRSTQGFLNVLLRGKDEQPVSASLTLTQGNRRISGMSGGSIELEQGTWQLQAESEGYEAVRQTVEIVAGKQQQVTISLTPLPTSGFLTVTARAEGKPVSASLTLTQGSQTISGMSGKSIELEQGKWQLKAESEGYEAVRQTVEIVAGKQQVTISLTPLPTSGFLTVTARAEGKPVSASLTL
ncbi:MAG: hypothetical protein GY795_38550, partial [Desulfobacterales bacterium]|nr:hypothetical protein [Desulfobacterales bacterium]